MTNETIQITSPTLAMMATVIYCKGTDRYYIGYVDAEDQRWHIGYSARTEEQANDYLRRYFKIVAINRTTCDLSLMTFNAVTSSIRHYIHGGEQNGTAKMG